MNRYVAFLRGMNLGGRRITNDELCAHFRDLGFENVSAFLASGNVIFDTSKRSAAKIATLIEDGLHDALNYEVPTFLRSAAEIETIAAREPFEQAAGAKGGKLQVALLGKKPTPAARKKVLGHATDDDQLAIHERELYWLPHGNMSKSDLDLKSIERALGPMTIRTKRTIDRLAAKMPGA